MLHGTFPNRRHHVDEPGHYGLLLIRIAHKHFTNVTTLVHEINFKFTLLDSIH